MSEETQDNNENTEVVKEEVVVSENVAPTRELINYDHFTALDIAIGTILSVDIVEGADKLLRLLVDVGETEPRQIVSGIRTYFANPEYLVGTQAPFLLNLEPRTIRGLESRGMILAGSTGETLALLNPHLRVPAGTRVR